MSAVASGEALLAKIRDKDKLLQQKEEEIDRLEKQLHAATRNQKEAESMLQQEKQRADNLEGKLAKAKESERAALLKVAKLQKEGKAAASMQLENHSLAAAANSSFAHPVDVSAIEAAPRGSNAAMNTPRTPQMAISLVAGPDGEEAARISPPTNMSLPPRPTPKASSPSVSTQPQNLQQANQLTQQMLALQNQFEHWQATAQIVLAAYKQRLATEEDEASARLEMCTSSASFLLAYSRALSSRCDSLSKSATLTTRLAEMDEEKRMNQFKELATLREQLVVVDREKAALTRELTTLDKSVVELEEQVRHLSREKHSIEEERDSLKGKVEQLSKSIVETNFTHDWTKEKSSILNHSELRTEVALLQEQMNSAQEERDLAQQKLRSAKTQFSTAQERMKALYADSVKSREMLLAELQVQRSMMQGSSHETDSAVAKAEAENAMHRMKQRIADLEQLVQHKNQALTTAQLQLARSQQNSRETTPKTKSVQRRDPYGAGMRSAEALHMANHSSPFRP